MDVKRVALILGVVAAIVAVLALAALGTGGP